MQIFIQSTHCSVIPSLSKSASRKDHSTMLKALLISVLTTKNLDLQLGFVRRAWKTSWATRILSVIKRRATKADCISEIRMDRQRLRRLLNILEIIL